MKINLFLRSKAFESLKMFWVVLDLSLVVLWLGIILPNGGVSMIFPTLHKVRGLIIGADLLIIPIWFIASLVSDAMDPFISVWDPKEEWDRKRDGTKDEQ